MCEAWCQAWALKSQTLFLLSETTLLGSCSCTCFRAGLLDTDSSSRGPLFILFVASETSCTQSVDFVLYSFPLGFLCPHPPPRRKPSIPPSIIHGSYLRPSHFCPCLLLSPPLVVTVFIVVLLHRWEPPRALGLVSCPPQSLWSCFSFLLELE